MTLARSLIYSVGENFLHFLSSPRAPFNLDNHDDDDDDAALLMMMMMVGIMLVFSKMLVVVVVFSKCIYQIVLSSILIIQIIQTKDFVLFHRVKPCVGMFFQDQNVVW